MQNIKGLLSETPERISDLPELAYNSWWSWHPEARMLFKMLNRPEWKLSVHNPVKMLMNTDTTILEKATKDQKFLRHYDAVITRFHEDMKTTQVGFQKILRLLRIRFLHFFQQNMVFIIPSLFMQGALGFLLEIW